ncbi:MULTISPECIES: hypothetical protein [Nocardia]|uniref:hypothetical protein n=1 Tax=Nocardia TaxID=1817 RepID=UPI0013003227|nr:MULTISPECIES: hypothetical protein [Nocardia]
MKVDTRWTVRLDGTLVPTWGTRWPRWVRARNCVGWGGSGLAATFEIFPSCAAFSRPHSVRELAPVIV